MPMECKNMDTCTVCNIALIQKTVSAEYATHLAKTSGLMIQSTYNYCPHCGRYYGVHAADQNALLDTVTRLEREIMELRKASKKVVA